jgi:hypothetical protein
MLKITRELLYSLEKYAEIRNKFRNKVIQHKKNRQLSIQEELDAYNPLIPDGSNWKATFMIEFADEAERKKQLARMINIENKVWVKVNGFANIIPIADEDLERTNEQKTSSVHFLRFDLTREMISALKLGIPLSAGIDHDAYKYIVDPVPERIRQALLKDLD